MKILCYSFIVNGKVLKSGNFKDVMRYKDTYLCLYPRDKENSRIICDIVEESEV